MKKIVLGFLLIAALAATHEVKAQAKTKYYYYPAENIYYNTTTKEYGYINTDSHWLWGNLPATLSIGDTTKYIALYAPNNDIWKQNAVHKMKYQNGRLKKVKIKTDD